LRGDSSNGTAILQYLETWTATALAAQTTRR
jgi:hypothetical protein